MEKYHVSKSYIVAAYMVATAFHVGVVVGGIPYACPKDAGSDRVILAIISGVIWPIADAVAILGYVAKDARCLSGEAFKEAPK